MTEAEPTIGETDSTRAMSGRYWMLGFLLAWLVIIVLRWEIIDSPPYYDFAFSFWPEANFLAENNFDLRALHSAPFLLSEHSGPRAYFTSILPTIAAIGIWLSPTTTFPFWFYHLFTFACAALTATSLGAILAPRVGNGLALLVVITAFLLPVYCGQVDMLGMEIPLATFATLTAYFLDRQRFLTAIAAAFGAFAMKSTGLIVLVALVGLLGLLLLSALLASARQWRLIGYYALCFTVAAALLPAEWAILRWGDTFSGQLMQGPPVSMMLVWCPDFATLLFVAAIFSAIATYRWLRGSGPNRQPMRSGFLDAGHLRIRKHSAAIFSLACLVGILIAVRTGPHLPRYFAFVVPLLFVVLTPSLVFTVGKPLAPLFFAVLLVVNVINWNGILYPNIDWGLERFAGIPAAAVARSGAFYERSHEYLADHRSTIAAMKIVEDHRDAGEWIMGMPFTYYLAFPSFGYVKKPVLGYSVNGITGVIPEFKETSDLYADKPAAPIFIKAATYFYAKQGQFQIPEPAPEDEILYRDAHPYPLVIFRKRWSQDPPSAEEVAAFYERQRWPEEQFAASVYYSLQNQGIEAAIEQVQRAKDSSHGTPEQKEWIDLLLAALLLRSGKTEEAAATGVNMSIQPAELLPHHEPVGHEVAATSRFEMELASHRDRDYDMGILCLKHLRLKDAADYFRSYLSSNRHRLEASSSEK